MEKEPYIYIYYGGKIYQKNPNNPYNRTDSNANWLKNMNEGFHNNTGRECWLCDHSIQLHNGMNNSRSVTAKFEDLLFLRESDKMEYPEYFI